MSKKINFGDNETFIALYDKLQSATKVGEYYGCTKNPVLKHAKEIGYDVNANKKYKLSEEDKKEILESYGVLTSTVLAEKYNVSRGMITKLWYDNNLSGKERDYSNAGYNLLGQQFGYLLVIGKSNKRTSNGGKYWNCQCFCGRANCLKEKEIPGAFLLNGDAISCGEVGKEKLALGRGKNFIDLTGERIGNLTVIKRIEDKIFSNGVKYVQWECKCDCNRITNVLASNLQSGNTQSCGFCGNNSHGNTKIAQLLDENNIFYLREKRFDACRDKNPLPFDFYVNDEYIIEFDGKQHFANTNTLYDYEITHKHDLIKSQWCKDNNTPLIRIPYTHYDQLCIEDLLLKTSKFIEI